MPNIVEYYQAQSSRSMSLEKSRELLYLIEDVAKAILVNSEKLKRQNKYLYSNMVDVLKMPEFTEICQDMEAHRFCTTAQFQQLIETMLENISDRQVYASPFLFRNLGRYPPGLQSVVRRPDLAGLVYEGETRH